MRPFTIEEPADFLGLAAPLVRDEARNNLFLGLANIFVDEPDAYPGFHLFVVEDEGSVTAAALMTPPYRLVLADAANLDALNVLVDHLLFQGIEVPGAVGNRPTIDAFVSAWSEKARTERRLTMAQGVFRVERVVPADAPGLPRRAGPADRELIIEWLAEFGAEAMPGTDREPPEALAARVDHRLQSPTADFWMWETDDRIVSLSGHSGPTGTGIRIGPVYTPPADRGRGYASALVAAQSEWLLQHGYQQCFLYTDLANQTSNDLYIRIGYEQIAESAEYLFG